MTAAQTAILIRDLNVGTDIDRMHSLIQGAIDAYRPRMTFMKDDKGNWYVILVTDMEEFAETRVDRIEERWGDKRLEMHPSNYTFTDLQVQ